MDPKHKVIKGLHSTYCFFYLSSLPPDISYQQCITTPSNWILETVSELRLAKWYMFSTTVSKCHNDLLEESERLVDIHGFCLCFTFRLQKENVKNRKTRLNALPGLQIRVLIGKPFSLFLIQNICCGYSKEPSQWDGSFEHPKHMIKLTGKVINEILGAQTILIWTYAIVSTTSWDPNIQA